MKITGRLATRRMRLALTLLSMMTISVGVCGVGSAAFAACDNPESLGVSRVLRIDTSGGARYGTFQYKPLPLQPGEVVLTFDDGPSSANTPKVLEALRKECVKATFFMIGRNIDKIPAVARAVLADGHTVGSHSWSHLDMGSLTSVEQYGDYDRNNRSLIAALGLTMVEFYRFPRFRHTPELLERTEKDGVAVISADITSEDWRGDAPEISLARVMTGLERKGGGILLFHDNQPNTVLLVPMVLAELKRKGYRVVALAPK